MPVIQVSILGSKRSMNIGIFLKQFKRPVSEMVEDIKQGNRQKFSVEKLKELCKLLPEEGEVKNLCEFNGDLSSLPEADQFMVLLVKVPSYEERLRTLVLQEEFFPLMEEMDQSITTMSAAAQELLACEDLHSVIRLVLKTGNYMNAGGYAGGAIGFRMTSLLKLADTKANKPGMNLMHYVAMAELQKEKKKLEEAKVVSRKQPDLQEQMESFLERADSRLAEIESSLQNLDSAISSLAEYFCEDPAQFKLEECCYIFHSFCGKFLRAIQENAEREVADVKRRQRERQSFTAKRRSTATCSARDKDVDSVALESILQKFTAGRGSRRKMVTPSPSSSSLTEIRPKGQSPEGDEESTSREKTPKNPSKSLELLKNEKNSNVDLNVNSQQEAKPHFEEVSQVPNEEKKEFRKPENIMVGVVLSPSRVDRTGHLWFSNESKPFLRRSPSVLSEEEEGDEEEEAQKLREVSRRVLRYQSRGSQSSGDYNLDAPQSPRNKCLSPQRRDFAEEKLDALAEQLSHRASKDVFSPHLGSRNTTNSLSRRHTFSIPATDLSHSDGEDRVLVPSTVPTRVPVPLGCLGKGKSLDSSQLPTKLEKIQNQGQKPQLVLSDSLKQKNQSRQLLNVTNHTGPQNENCPTSALAQQSDKPQTELEQKSGAKEPALAIQQGNTQQEAQNASQKPSKPMEKSKVDIQENKIFASFSLFFKRFSEKSKSKDPVGNLSK
ncbi:FH2 domain-containing protein 1-like [Scleropages formosus]|uniref:FH2 domain-containing protein 1-like n=1 Tax=Scleropages formosus TaxID=113540 RepID=A0A0P7Y082_SCLFO|nr:FH2 domain-containing protein 1-like [Scleropages formosus]